LLAISKRRVAVLMKRDQQKNMLANLLRLTVKKSLFTIANRSALAE